MKSTEPAQARQAGERRYHHGHLAVALLDAGEAELNENGIDAFSLRGVAKRAGVSHAAPAHHFADVNGLLTAIAARGFERFVARQEDFRKQTTTDPRAQLEASGVGYVAFAMENPALFRLMFGSDRPNFEAPLLQSAAGLAYENLAIHVAAVTNRREKHACEAAAAEFVDIADIAAVWALAHGLADLLAAGRLKSLQALPAEALNRVVAKIVSRALP